MCILNDDTTKKNTKKTLNNLYKNINQAILIANKTEIVYLNKKFTKISGYSLNEIKKLHFELLTNEKDLNKLKVNLKILRVKPQNSLKQEISIIAANKNEINLKLKLFSIILDNNRYYVFAQKKINSNSKKSFTDKELSTFKQIENKYIRNQKRLRKILDLVPHIIFLKDEEGKILLANKACEKFYNKSVKELVYSNISNFHNNKQELNRMIDEDIEVIKTNQRIELIDTVSTDYKNQKHFFNTTKIPFTDPVTKKTNSLGISIEITQQKIEKQKLNEAKEKYRLLVERGSDGIIILENKKIVFANNQAAKLFEQPIANFTNKKITEFIKKEEFQKISEQYTQNAISKNIDNSYEIKIDSLSNEKKYVEAKINSISYATKKSSLIFLRDITKRKKAEQLRERDKNMLEQAQKISKLGSWEWNIESKKIFCSDEIYNIVEIDKSTKKDQANWFMEFIPESEKSKIFKSFLNAYRSGGKCEMEFPIITAKKNRKIIHAQSQVFKTKNGKQSVIGTWLDITERIKLEQILKSAKAKAEESDKLKSAFLANMSHEIRTPMNAIMGFANLLKMFDLNENTKREYIDHIVSSGDSLLNLIDDIIDISKMESNQITMDITNVNLNKLLNQIYSRYEELILLKHNSEINLVLEKAIENENFIIKTDSHRLQQIISNLINNALKFTKNGEIKFGYLINGENLLFFVKDTGIGIDKKSQAIIFKRFGKLEDPERLNKSGTGLGLSISKHLVEILNGKIWVESEQGKGAKFYFSIPLKKVNSDLEIVIDETTSVYQNKKPNLKGKIILIAEDEILNFKLLENLVSKTGAKVLWAKNGLQAIEIFSNRNDIDLIFMDIKMPKVDGYQATREIKKINPEIPIIAQTAFAFANEKQAILDSGCNRYIKKPIKHEEIYQVLEKYLCNKKKTI
ncbi:MAG: PAS domain S-box protein [Bacteroidales bacterium]|nr:PAS domain S-box protein [Bacteroidales bacterium]MBN2756384.1 PAS domain S-box protein [Bacteroidales bacterium]